MKERIYLNLGDNELLAIVIRNGLFSGSWKRMHLAIAKGGLVLPGISVHTITNLHLFEKNYKLNLNGIVFSGNKTPAPGRLTPRRVQRICYAVCRGLFSYPCVAGENRVDPTFPGTNVHRTYLARPMFNYPSNFNSPYYQGVNRMKPNPIKEYEPTGDPHDRLLVQLNKIRECNPCDEQPNCLDHKYVTEATAIVIKEYQLENSFVGKLLARSLCWMTAEESRLMRLIEKEGLMIEPQAMYPPDTDEDIQEEFFPQSELEGYFSDNPDPTNLPTEPHPLLDVIHDLRESIRDTIRLLSQLKNTVPKAT